MIDTSGFLSFMHNKGVSFASGVPCSYFSRIIDELATQESIKYVPATREDEGENLGG